MIRSFSMFKNQNKSNYFSAKEAKDVTPDS